MFDIASSISFWSSIAAAAFSIASLLVCVTYVIGSATSDEKMKTWAKQEAFEVIYSAVIISLGFTGFDLADKIISTAITGNNPSVTSTYFSVKCESGKKTYEYNNICGETIASNSNSPYFGVDSCSTRLGMWFLREIFDEGKEFAFNIYSSYIRSTMLAEFGLNFEFMTQFGGMISFNPWKGFFSIGNKIKETAFDWTIKVVTLVKFQEIFLRFISIALTPSFFIIGAIFRILPFTRKLGGLLLAMSIALYFVFPAFYAFGGLIFLQMKNSQNKFISDTNSPHKVSIINTMYTNGSFPMLGGSSSSGTSSLSFDDVRNDVSSFECMKDSEFLSFFESGSYTSSTGQKTISPSFDFSSRTSTTDELKYKLEKAYNATDSWLSEIRKTGKYDDIVETSWSKSGPIDVIARLTFWAFFFSALSIISTIGAIRSLSIVFGGDIEIAGLTRLI